jgi:hypothetical protein
LKIYVKFETGNRWFFDAKWFENINEAFDYAESKGYEIHSVSRSHSFVRDGSGFKPHYNYSLGEYINDKGQYRRLVKERGLEEIGNEKLQSGQSKPKPYVDKDVIKYVQEVTGKSVDDGFAREATGG